MSRKISVFFTKRPIKIESSEVEPNVISYNIDDKLSVKSKFEEKFHALNETSAQNPQNLSSNNNSGQENQNRINENVKTETEQQLLVFQQQIFF